MSHVQIRPPVFKLTCDWCGTNAGDTLDRPEGWQVLRIHPGQLPGVDWHVCYTCWSRILSTRMATEPLPHFNATVQSLLVDNECRECGRLPHEGHSPECETRTFPGPDSFSEPGEG
jgi:hypothetical protein